MNEEILTKVINAISNFYCDCMKDLPATEDARVRIIINEDFMNELQCAYASRVNDYDIKGIKIMYDNSGYLVCSICGIKTYVVCPEQLSPGIDMIFILLPKNYRTDIPSKAFCKDLAKYTSWFERKVARGERADIIHLML